MAMIERTRLLLVDQTTFSSLAPKMGERSPYMDHRLIESKLLRLDEIVGSLIRGVTKAIPGAVKAVTSFGRKAAGVVKQGITKGKALGDKAKQGFDKAKQGFDKAKQGFDKAKGALPEKDTPAEGDALKRSPEPFKTPRPEGAPPTARKPIDAPKPQDGQDSEPSSDEEEPAPEEETPSSIPSDGPTDDDAEETEAGSKDGTRTGPRGARLVSPDGKCPTGRTKSSLDGAGDDKRCNIQTAGRPRH